MGERVVAALGLAPDHRLTLEELMKLAAAGRTTVQRAIAALEESETITRTGAGVKGDPFRWQVHPAVTPIWPWNAPIDPDEWVMGTA